MVIASERSWFDGIEFGIRHHELIVDVATSVMPKDGTSIAEETATSGIASATRTDEIHSRTADEKVGMIVHATCIAPKGKRIVSIRNDIAIDDDGTSCLAIHSELMGGRIGDGRTIIVYHRQSRNHTVVGIRREHHDAMQSFLASIFRTHRQVVCLGTHNDATVAMLTHEHDVWTVDNHLFVIESLLDEDFERFLSLLWRFLDGRLNALATLHHSIEKAFIHFWHHT